MAYRNTCKVWLLAVSTGVTSLSIANLASADPIIAQMARCVPKVTGDSSGGQGNEPGSRWITIEYGLASGTAADDADKQAALDETTRLDVCIVSPSGFIDCPGDSDPTWIIFDDIEKPAEKPIDATWIKNHDEAGAREEFDVQLDWADSQHVGEFLILRANRDELHSVMHGGFCPIGTPVLSNDRFSAIAVIDAALEDPFMGVAGDVCTAGDKSGTTKSSPCMPEDSIQFMLDRMLNISEWQQRSVIQPSIQNLDPPVWANGQSVDCEGVWCKTWVRTSASRGAAGGGLGTFFMPTSIQYTAATAPKQLSAGAGADLRLMTHELWHNLQNAWSRAYPSTLYFTPSVFETTPPSIECNACMFGYPGVSANQCVSARKLGFDWFAGINSFDSWLDSPSKNPVTFPYVGSIFWRYAMEQYAEELRPNHDNPSHPSGTTSQLERGAGPLGDPLRRSDEGADLLGHLFTYFASHPQEDAVSAIDEVLRQNLGRGLDAMMLDLHTAAVLKDYADIDSRWRFEWVGDYNAGGSPLVPTAPAPNKPLSELKNDYLASTGTAMLPIPSDLVGKRKDSDGLRRARRELDSYSACTFAGCIPPKIVLNNGEFLAGTEEVFMQGFGAAYLSVHPGNGIGFLRVGLRPTRGSEPRFRVFVVEADGTPILPAGCNIDQDGDMPEETGMCQMDLDGNLNALVPVGLGGKEVIVVASAGSKPASFRWSFGNVEPRVDIISPKLVAPVEVGHPATGKRPFLAQVKVLDENNEPLGGIGPSDFAVRVPRCSGPAAPTCSLGQDDIRVTSMGEGTFWILGTIPDNYYPALAAGSHDTFNLWVGVNGNSSGDLSAEEIDSLVTREDSPKLATQLVLDKSGSMSDFGGAKLEALKVASSLIVESMADTDELGVVSFNNDATTLLGVYSAETLLPLDAAGRTAVSNALNNLIPGGWTSIGDGALEAQSNFIYQYGDVVDPSIVQHMIIVSDGLSNADWGPAKYYLGSPAQHTDGPKNPNDDPDPDPSDNLPWWPGELSYHDRMEASLQVPLVSTVAIGQDADFTELKNLARVGNGVFSYVEDVGSIHAIAQATLDMSDAFRTSMNEATGLQRTSASRSLIPEPSELPTIQVYPRTEQLLVSVASSECAFRGLRLISPTGASIAPEHEVGPGITSVFQRVAVYRVPEPERGDWSWAWQPEVGGISCPQSPFGETVFIESAIESPLVLFASIDTSTAMALGQSGMETENGNYVGSRVVFRAIPTEGAPILGATVSAEVRGPTGNVALVELKDDGLHHDGASGDGIYGGMLNQPTAEGVFSVNFVAQHPGSSEQIPFRREKRLALELHHGADSDDDRLPDWWEEKYGTDPAVKDSGEDPDGDGLTNFREFMFYTSPWDSDTDGGGQSDGSEVDSGRDPLQKADDFSIRPVWPELIPCNGMLRFRLKDAQLVDNPVLDLAAAVELQRASSDDGPFQTVFEGFVAGDGMLTLAAENQEPGCYRMRRVTDGLTGAWSPVTCATPKEDPFSPSVTLMPTSPAGSWSRSRLVRVHVEVDDSGTDAGSDECGNVVSSGVSEMLVSTRADFLDSVWLPFSNEVENWFPEASSGTVWVKVRDAAGNESIPMSFSTRFASVTALDRAVVLEEQALDAMRDGEWWDARQRISDSIPELRTSLRTVAQRVCQSAPEVDPVDLELLDGMIWVRIMKASARGMSNRWTGDVAQHLLGQALERERELADKAMVEGKEL